MHTKFSSYVTNIFTIYHDFILNFDVGESFYVSSQRILRSKKNIFILIVSYFEFWRGKEFLRILAADFTIEKNIFMLILCLILNFDMGKSFYVSSRRILRSKKKILYQFCILATDCTIDQTYLCFLRIFAMDFTMDQNFSLISLP